MNKSLNYDSFEEMNTMILGEYYIKVYQEIRQIKVQTTVRKPGAPPAETL